MPVKYGSTQFSEQIKLFKNKTHIPTERWNDLQREAHDTGFMVAGAAKADLLADLHDALQKAIEQGTTLQEFRKDFADIVIKHGWTDFYGSESKAGIAWRTRIIYDTNIRSSYMAGRWQQIQAGKAYRPYLQYKHSHAVITPRAEHLGWNGLILPVDDPWWQSHYPPNGYGCQCTVFALSERDLARMGKTGPDTAPNDGTYEWTDKKTGEIHEFPVGVQPFWDYAPGASLTQRAAAQIVRKLPTLPVSIDKDLQKAVQTVIDSQPVKAYIEQKTAQAAAKFLVDNDICDAADFGKIKDMAIINQWCHGLFELVQEFPELRKNQKFTGSIQAANKVWYEAEKARVVGELLKQGLTVEQAEYWAVKKIKKLKAPNAFAMSRKIRLGTDVSNGISMNESYFAGPTALAKSAESMRDCELSKWWPKDCNNVASIVRHELGHQLDYLVDARNAPELKNLFNQYRKSGTTAEELSKYGSTSIAEFIAEAWAEYRSSPNPRSIATTVGEFILRRYTEQYRN